MKRNMWCAGGFLHAVGLTVAGDGRILPREKVPNPVYTFDHVEVCCSPDGVTRWKKSPNNTDRFMFHVQNVPQYPRAMTKALRSLLKHLP